MPFVRVGEENSGSIELYYEDHGEGRPVVLIHGWPLSCASWERQVPALLETGHRVVVYDRRGFGRSSRPAAGYDYDTLAHDLHLLLNHLDLRDATLVGFSMGGGEVARFVGTYGNERLRHTVLISAIPPFLLKTRDNPEGVDQIVFDTIIEQLRRDRPAFLSAFLGDFYNVDLLSPRRVSEEAIRAAWNVAAAASPQGTSAAVRAWATDFRSDLARFDLPTLVVHGDNDRIVPLAASGARTGQLVRGARTVVMEGAPHGLIWTHSDEVNRELLSFIQ